MAVHRNVDFVNAAHVLNHIADKRRVILGHGVTHRVGNIDGCRACLDCRFQHFAQKFGLAARRVLRRKLDVGALTLCVSHRRARPFKHFFGSHLQLVTHVKLARRQKNVYSRVRGFPDRFPRDVDVLFERPRQRSHYGILDHAGNAFDRLKISRRSDCKACLDNVHAQPVQLLRHAQLFAYVHAASRRLLAVAERSVEYLNSPRFFAHVLLLFFSFFVAVVIPINVAERVIFVLRTSYILAIARVIYGYVV